MGQGVGAFLVKHRTILVFVNVTRLIRLGRFYRMGRGKGGKGESF